MTKFEASNGVVVEDNCNGDKDYWNITGPRGGIAVNRDEQDALREFFRHERDEELGRWRDTVNPSYFVIKNDYDRVVVVNERSSRWTEVTPKIVADYPDVIVEHQVGARYFAAHPVQQPWHNAGRDDVWKFTTKDGRRAALAWRSLDDWDVITPRGASITGAADPLAALVEHGFPEFAGIVSAVEMKAVSNG